ncbi:hypothetical protein GGR52DRAFT_545752 [Hypoxylon sp. FL1284]|nr:hypothetical protein GGR52DRAFT_545752 [Hypoxylon sp. FL1284]
MNVLWPFGVGGPSISAHVLRIVLLGCLTVVLYRFALHPLARFPGPVAAASTGLYEAYYDCIKDSSGRYWVGTETTHRRYGMHSLPR